MAFKVQSTLDGAQPPFEYYLLKDGEAAVLGEGFVQTSGRLTKCGVTATPQFIAQRTQALEASSVTPLPVIRVTEQIVWETKSTVTVAATLIGSKVTLHTDALLVTATTSSGVFELTYTDGVTDGGVVRGLFSK